MLSKNIFSLDGTKRYVLNAFTEAEIKYVEFQRKDNFFQLRGLPWWIREKRICLQCADPGSIPGLGRSLGEGNGNPLQYSYLENPTDGEAWWATVHGVAKSWTE